jgi:uncharacterized membrane-anchored protein
MSPKSRVLIDYWKRLPTASVDERRAALGQVCAQVQALDLDRSTILPYALADHDEHVVHEATLAYVSPKSAVLGTSAVAVADALEWIRRRLALNRGAVFAALLSLDDQAVIDRLAGLRLTLDADEAATVFRRGARSRSARVQEFLESWQELAVQPPAQPAGELAAA